MECIGMECIGMECIGTEGEGEGKVIMAGRGLRGMIWICERCADEGKSDAVCMVKGADRPPGKGSAVWEDGKRMRCDRCEWKSVDELE